MSKTYYKHIVLIPVYNDWEPLAQTISEVRKEYNSQLNDEPYLVIVNDGSSEKANLPSSNNIKILHLRRNLGHQKAIVTGLAYIHERYHFDDVVIMDADGEDIPANIIDLFRSPAFPGKIIMARRTQRREGISFQLLYRLYKLFFLSLTGKTIAFGNFCLMSEANVEQLIYHSEIWNNVAGGVLKSGIPYSSIPIPKGKRTGGKSKMNFTSLIVHGLNTIAVFIEIISVRILILSFIIIILSASCIGAIAFIRIFTDYAIPGWASILASSMLVVLLQSFLISLIMIVIFLSSQAQRKFIPALHYTDYLKVPENPADGK